MHRRILQILALSTLATACANQPHGRVPGDAQTPRDEAPDGADAALADADARAGWRPSVVLEARLHGTAMTEAVVDPHGRAALTLDDLGGVRLWPDLQAQEGDTPLVLPVSEPMWMSLAGAGRGFVVAFIDTAGGARVGRITITDGRARWIPTFEIPSTDPVFEIHVLDGGRRILALSVDHRLELRDIDGEVLSVLDQRGFAPWQLRVAQPAGRDPTVLAVLSDPVRVQPITVADDELRVGGKARSVALDRGPNRNDLALTPDGATVLALRRPEARGKRLELELIDVESGARRILAAESDTRMRPRLHACDDDRALLETGSGNGYWVDFDVAAPWPPADGAPDRTAIPLTPLSAFALPSSTEAARMHTVIVAGHRFVPTRDTLVVDPIEGEGHVALGRRAFRPTAAALDATGDRVAWATRDAIVIESLEQPGPVETLDTAGAGAQLLAFVGDDRLVGLASDGGAILRRIADGEVLATRKVAFEWSIANAAWRPDGESTGGEIVLSSSRPKEPLHVLTVSTVGFGEVRDVARARQVEWPEAGKPRNLDSRRWTEQLGLAWEELHLRPAKVELTEPDPTGRRIAIAQKTAHHERFDVLADALVVGPHDYVVTVYDREARTRSFTHAAVGLTDLAWSGDGTRLAVAHETGGLVLDAGSGATVLERHDLGPDVVVATAADARDTRAQ